MMSDEYRAALDSNDLAIAAFAAVRAGYRAGSVSTDDFLAAKAVYDAAMAAFDAAYAAEESRESSEAAPAAAPDSQLNLFHE